LQEDNYQLQETQKEQENVREHMNDLNAQNQQLIAQFNEQQIRKSQMVSQETQANLRTEHEEKINELEQELQKFRTSYDNAQESICQLTNNIVQLTTRLEHEHDRTAELEQLTSLKHSKIEQLENDIITYQDREKALTNEFINLRKELECRQSTPITNQRQQSNVIKDLQKTLEKIEKEKIQPKY